MMAALPNIHPGDILREDYLEPLGWTPYRLAKLLGISPTAVGEILRGRRAVSAETALRLGRVLRTTPHFWLNLQAAYDLEEAETQMAEKLEALSPAPEISLEGVDDFDEEAGPAEGGRVHYRDPLPAYAHPFRSTSHADEDDEDAEDAALLHDRLPLAA